MCRLLVLSRMVCHRVLTKKHTGYFQPFMRTHMYTYDHMLIMEYKRNVCILIILINMYIYIYAYTCPQTIYNIAINMLVLPFIPTEVVGIFPARLLISHPCGWPGNKATNMPFCNYSIHISSVNLTCMLGADHIHSGTSSFRAYILTWHDYQRYGYIDTGHESVSTISQVQHLRMRLEISISSHVVFICRKYMNSLVMW